MNPTQPATGDTHLDALITGLENEGLDPHGVVVVHRGREIARVEWAPYRLDAPALVYSVSKTFTSLAIGCLVADGLVDPRADVADYLDLPNPHGFRVHDLLTMSTGHSAEQLQDLPLDAATLLPTPPDLPRGTFAYSSPASFVLGEIVRAVSGQELTELLAPRLIEPLGLGPLWWQRWAEPGREPVEMGASGLHISVDDLATLGRLLLANGVWHGRRLLDPTYLDAMRTAHVPTADPAAPDDPAGQRNDWAHGYGYQVWLNREGYRLDGAFGQFVLVVPERELVIVYAGATTTTQATLDLLWRYADSLPPGPAPAGAVAGGDHGSMDDDDVAAPAVARESWSSRDALPGEAEIDLSGWRLDDAPGGSGSGSWLLTRPGQDHAGGEVRVGTDQWTRSVLTAATRDGTAQGTPDTLVVAARGEQREDGSVGIHVVVPTSPHRILLERTPGGELSGRWHIAPLRSPGLAILHTPPWLTNPAGQQ